MTLNKHDKRYLDGVLAFCNFAASNLKTGPKLHKCLCKKCNLQWLPLPLDDMFHHLWTNGFMSDYTVWVEHGERADIPSLYDRRQQIIEERASSSTPMTTDLPVNPTADILYDCFPFMDRYATEQNDSGLGDAFVDDVDRLDPIAKDAFEKYNRLLTEAHTPVYEGSKETVLTTILKAVKMKIENKI